MLHLWKENTATIGYSSRHKHNPGATTPTLRSVNFFLTFVFTPTRTGNGDWRATHTGEETENLFTNQPSRDQKRNKTKFAYFVRFLRTIPSSGTAIPLAAC